MSRIFRAHWTDDSAHQDSEALEVYGGRAARARDGLRLLQRAPRVDVAMFSEDDWHFLLSLCDPGALRGLEVYRHDASAVPEVSAAEGEEVLADASEAARAEQSEREREQRRVAFAAGWQMKVRGKDDAVRVRVAADVYYTDFLGRLRGSELECQSMPRPPSVMGGGADADAAQRRSTYRSNNVLPPSSRLEALELQ